MNCRNILRVWMHGYAMYVGYSFRMLLHIVGQGQLLSPFFPTAMYTHTLSHPQGQHVAHLMWLLHQPGACMLDEYIHREHTGVGITGRWILCFFVRI